MLRVLFFSFFLIFNFSLKSQCIPDTSISNSTWGLWPDTIQNLPNAIITLNYNTVLQLKTPITVDEVVDQPVDVGGLTLDLTGWPVDSLKLVNVIGLPSGITWSCDNSNCSWLGDDVGCIELFGTPTVGGVYDLTFQIDGFITLGAMGVMSVSGATGGYLDYTGYQINVSTCIPNSSVNTATACNSYDWNGNTYTASGSYDYVTTNVSGCDSTATLNLTINNTSSSNTTVIACDSYEWNGVVYDSSGSYDYVTQNAAGCDSTATLNLTINNASSSTTTVTACDFYTWPVNGLTYNSSAIDTVTGFNAFGCMALSILNLNITVTPNINIYSSLNPPNGSNCPHICLGDSIVLEVDTGFYSYIWSTGQIADTVNRIVTYPQGNTNYVVDVLDINGCLASDTICVEVWESPLLSISSSPSPAVICIGDTITLEASSGFGYYYWNSSYIDTGIVLFDNPSQNTWYVVEAIDTNGCSVLEDINVIVDSCGTSNINNLINSFSIYPNPSKGKFNIIMSDLNYNATKVKVLNSLGRTVYFSDNLDENFILDLSGNKTGIYYLFLSRENHKIIRKIVLLK